jgi:hypothetical protein
MGHLLTGLVFDDRGHPMVPTHTSKGRNVRYRYYTSRGLIRGQGEDPGSPPRVAAPAIEDVVLSALKEHLTAARWTAFNQTDGAIRWKLLRQHVRRVTLARDQVAIEFTGDGARVEIPICLKTRGGETLIVTPLGPSKNPRVDASLVKALSRAWNWRASLERGRVSSPVELARTDGCTVRYVTRILRLAYLPPDVIEAILAGRQPCDLTLARLLKIDIPLDWQAERQALGF